MESEVVVGLAEGGIYEIAGHSTVGGDGEPWRPVGSGLDVCVLGVGKVGVSCTSRTFARACTSRTGHAGFRGAESLKSRDQNAIGRRQSPASPCSANPAAS